jgi:hypothetical protein
MMIQIKERKFGLVAPSINTETLTQYSKKITSQMDTMS